MIALMAKCKQCGKKIKKSKWDRPSRPRAACSLHCRQVLNGRKNLGVYAGVTGRNHPRFKTGRFLSEDGYWKVLSRSHPFPRKFHYMSEHVKKVEMAMGRRLAPNECVHHRNGNTADNRLANLRLMTKSDHSKLHRGTL
jgi:hypothetical protein